MLGGISVIGSIVAYGMQTWNTPLESPSSMLNVVTTTISDGVATFANCVCISERTYSNWIGCTGSQDFFLSFFPSLGYNCARVPCQFLHRLLPAASV